MKIRIDEGVLTVGEYQDDGELSFEMMGDMVVIASMHDTGEGWDAEVEWRVSLPEFFAHLASVGICPPA